MIPTKQQVRALWDTHRLPEEKRTHCTLVAGLAVGFARALMHREHCAVDIPLLEAAALLHDIDKAVPRLPGERHPDTAVRILREAGMGEVADVVRRHPLHAVLHADIMPTSTEEQLLYLSDKMVKNDIITVDKRFELWRDENLPPDAVAVLDAAYPEVKALEREYLRRAGIKAEDAGMLATAGG